MGDAFRAGVKPNVIMFTILIVGYARKGDPDAALRVFRDMVNSGVKPDPPSIDAIASAYFFVGAYQKARRIFLDFWSSVQSPLPLHLEGASLQRLSREMRALKAEKKDHLPLSRVLRAKLRFKLKILERSWKFTCLETLRRRYPWLGKKSSRLQKATESKGSRLC